MIAHISVGIRKLKRWLNRSYWSIRLLKLSKSEGTSTSPGLILIQIDGLAHHQFERALKEGNLPFLLSLIEKQKYRTHVHYSGLPSATPAVQGELFYGVKGCVPAFNFKDQKSGKIFTMYEAKCTGEIEESLSKQGEPLLTGGSSYSNIFTGGAMESHYCASSFRWEKLFKALNPFVWPIILLFHVNMFVRTFLLLVVEFFFAFIDFVKGVLKGEKILMELQFILTRVVICITIRELIVLGVKIDIVRGLPIIHLNLFGYDEQAHRRGPSSKFAHWCLRGIDDSIKRIWREAMLAERRDYDVWIYSDHGQEDTIPYSVEHHKSVESVIENIFGEFQKKTKPVDYTANFWKSFFHMEHSEIKGGMNPKVVVAGMGPIGHIYPALPLSDQEEKKIVKELLETAKVPVVFLPRKNGKVEAYTSRGKYMLPEDASKILGEDHPFLEEATQDLVSLCEHPSAGALIFSGWLAGESPRTFPIENGSHAGYGSYETRGFALLPQDAPLLLRARPYIRPLDIRDAALRYMNRLVTPSVALQSPETNVLRIMTYNVHGCRGMDGKLSPERIARVIARHDLDIVALQELDVGRNRSGNIDQAEIIARKLQMSFHFHPSFCLEDEKYGNAILSRYPMRNIFVGGLPRFKSRHLEPRGALWVEIDMNGRKINILTSHLSLWPGERLLQTEALMGEEWLGNPSCREPVILCGDFNANLRSKVCKRISCKLRDIQKVLRSQKRHHTWFTSYPMEQIDHIFVSSNVEVTHMMVPNTELDRIASDHLPLIAELKIN